MDIQELKTKQILPRLQAIVFTENGFLLDSCNTLFDLQNSETPLFEIFPFLKRYSHVYSSLSSTKSKDFEDIDLEYQGKTYHLNLSFSHYEGQVACVMEDITRFYKKKVTPTIQLNGKDVNEHLIEEIEQSRKIQKVRQDHFAKIAHDFKLPLTEIVGTIYLLKNYINNEKGATYIEALDDAANNLNEMLNDLMTFTKSESQKFKISSRPFSIKKVMQSAVNSYEYKAVKKGVPLYIDIDSDIPDTVIGDSMRLWQIVCNLLDNALKFTPKGEIRLQVSSASPDHSKNEYSNNCQLQFKVKDTGIGIPQESIRSIFDTYNQVHHDQLSQKGFGIGLSIVKQLIELQGGTFDVESRLGEGSTFQFVLDYPLEEAAIVK